jgi:adenylate cyclase
VPATGRKDVVIGPFKLDRFNRSLTRGGVSIPLGGRAADLLGVLAAADGEMVGKGALLEQVWPGLTVDENNLQVQISALRKAMGPGWIVTVPGRGYRLAMAPPDEQPDPAAGKPAIAVLPFVNLSGDIDQEYFTDGIVEDIITELSRLPWLFVIARTSSFFYRNRTADIRQVARELEARYVLEGSVRRSGDRLRVTAQLIDAGTGTHIWAERYDRTIADLFAVQDEITEAVAVAIGGIVSSTEQLRALRRPPANLSAWEAYQRGLWYFSRLTPDDAERAIELLRRSQSLDPQFVPALTALALVLVFQATGLSRVPFDATMEQAEQIARRAVALAPHHADTHAILAIAQLFRGDCASAETHIDQAAAIDPGAAKVLHGSGMLRVFTGRREEGREALRAFLRRNPRDQSRVAAMVQIALSYYHDGDYLAALAEARQAIEYQPDHALAYRWAAASLGQLGRRAEAAAMLRKAQEVSPVAFEFFVRTRPPWVRTEDHAHMLDGLRKAGWQG